MGMDIEVVGSTIYTVHLTDEDVEKVRHKLIETSKANPMMDGVLDTDVCEAISELYAEDEIELYFDGKATESDFCTEEIRWSEFEDREPEEIFNIFEEE